MTKCFGIISYLPDDVNGRKLRKERVQRLFKQLGEFWPEVDILLITQNWKKTKLPESINKIDRVDFEKGLGILQARKTLREEFLKRDYDYIIMFDDDSIIEEVSEGSSKTYLEEIDNHENGYCFLQYDSAQLNGCAISKTILEKEPIVEVDAQKNEAYEDTVYSNLIHYKYPNFEFKNNNIRCTQFCNPNEPAPSTWANDECNWKALTNNTAKIVAVIKDKKEFPKDWRSFCDNGEEKQKKPRTYMNFGYSGL